MPAIVLESSLGSEYEDTPTSYEFPGRYLSAFAPLNIGIPIHAVIYEPRGDANTGSMKYVALATISSPPADTNRRSRNGERLFRVVFDQPAIPFDQPVPREVGGLPVETWLRALPRGRPRNVATLGRAVRPLSDEDFQQIVQLGQAHLLESSTYPLRTEHEEPAIAIRERTERFVSTIKRDALFRAQVLSSYSGRCSVSGFSLGSVSLTRASGLLDAAHIRPVGQDGPDTIGNGLPLTPTLHRLFDAGLFTVAYREGWPTVVRSPRLTTDMISAPERGFVLPLQDGLRLLTPMSQSDWPSPEQLAFHMQKIYQGG
jgi:putative restriction endonuclease